MSESKEQQKHFYLRNNDALMNSTKLSMKAKQSILLSKAENTVDAYESDWDDFVDWCTYQKVPYFPATPETIVNYIMILLIMLRQIQSLVVLALSQRIIMPLDIGIIHVWHQL